MFTKNYSSEIVTILIILCGMGISNATELPQTKGPVFVQGTPIANDPPEMPNYPKFITHYYQSGIGNCVFESPVFGNLAGDTKLEVVVASDAGDIYAFTWNGQSIFNPPLHTTYLIRGGTALGDIDGDGDLEVIVADAACLLGGASDGYLYAWHHNGSQVFSPIHLNGDVFGTPVLSDLDSDGDLEIIVATRLHPNQGSLYVFHGTGSLFNGWPQPIDGEAYSAPAVGDVDSDGALEIVVAASANGVYMP